MLWAFCYIPFSLKSKFSKENHTDFVFPNLQVYYILIREKTEDYIPETHPFHLLGGFILWWKWYSVNLQIGCRPIKWQKSWFSPILDFIYDDIKLIWICHGYFENFNFKSSGKRYFSHDLKKKTLSKIISTSPFSKVYNIKRFLAPKDTKVFCQDQVFNLQVIIFSLHKEGNAKSQFI